MSFIRLTWIFLIIRQQEFFSGSAEPHIFFMFLREFFHIETNVYYLQELNEIPLNELFYFRIQFIFFFQMNWIIIRKQITLNIPVIFQVASLLAALAHPGHIVCYAPGDSLPCRRDSS
ncbi:hypothetical protein C6H68_21175 [Photorhabdus luminescens]|nr:hypothetical protein C6H68_21175 [Photorhabdus luminescens]